MKPVNRTLLPRRSWLLAALVAPLALSACDALKPKTPEDVVAKRAQERWDALIAGDYEKAWEFTQPGYRAIIKRDDYRKQFGRTGRWVAVQIHEVHCTSQRCTVRIRLTSEVRVPGIPRQEVTSYTDETWIRDDGKWWYEQRL